MFIDPQPGPDSGVLVAIGDLEHDDQAREHAAQVIHLALALGTLWRLRRTSDTTEDALVMRRAC